MNAASSMMLSAAASLLLSSAAWSAALHVSPVNLQLEAGQQATGVTLSNPSDEPLVAQVRVLAWTQEGGADRLAAQPDVVASPPIATIAAHGEQLVRVIRLSRAKPERETAYRLVVDELPDPSAAGGAGAVDIRIRYSIPLFVLPPMGLAEPQLQWELTHRDGVAYLRVTNSGGLHAQLSAVTLIRADGSESTMAAGLLGYALAGAANEWQLPSRVATGSGTARISARVNGHAAEFHTQPAPTVAAQ